MRLFRRPRAMVLRNACVVGAGGMIGSSLRIEQGAIAGLDIQARGGDAVFDLQGAFVFPGLVNAHDHLEHNHFGKVAPRPPYANASEWADDMSPRLKTDRALIEGKARPLADRLFIGGIKNLLSGATTVAHHNPLYRELGRGFPVRLVRNFGWAHSLYLQDGKAGARGEAAGVVADRYRATPTRWPFIIHLAEGIDAAARGELEELRRLALLGPNLLLVHGVGIDRAGWRGLARSGAGVIWCPASNAFLLGESLDRERLSDPEGPRLALGTDSRLTGSRDLLDELRVAAAASGAPGAAALVRMVTVTAADLLRLPAAGRLAAGLPADLLILPPLAADPHEALLRAERRHVSLVMIDGQARYGAPELTEVFAASGVAAAPVVVDGAARVLDRALARRLRACSIVEPGVEAPA